MAKNKWFVLVAGSAEEKQSWMDAIRKEKEKKKRELYGLRISREHKFCPSKFQLMVKCHGSAHNAVWVTQRLLEMLMFLLLYKCANHGYHLTIYTISKVQRNHGRLSCACMWFLVTAVHNIEPNCTSHTTSSSDLSGAHTHMQRMH